MVQHCCPEDGEYTSVFSTEWDVLLARYGKRRLYYRRKGEAPLENAGVEATALLGAFAMCERVVLKTDHPKLINAPVLFADQVKWSGGTEHNDGEKVIRKGDIDFEWLNGIQSVYRTLLAQVESPVSYGFLVFGHVCNVCFSLQCLFLIAFLFCNQSFTQTVEAEKLFANQCHGALKYFAQTNKGSVYDTVLMSTQFMVLLTVAQRIVYRFLDSEVELGQHVSGNKKQQLEALLSLCKTCFPKNDSSKKFVDSCHFELFGKYTIMHAIKGSVNLRVGYAGSAAHNAEGSPDVISVPSSDSPAYSPVELNMLKVAFNLKKEMDLYQGKSDPSMTMWRFGQSYSVGMSSDPNSVSSAIFRCPGGATKFEREAFEREARNLNLEEVASHKAQMTALFDDATDEPKDWNAVSSEGKVAAAVSSRAMIADPSEVKQVASRVTRSSSSRRRAKSSYHDGDDSIHDDFDESGDEDEVEVEEEKEGNENVFDPDFDPDYSPGGTTKSTSDPSVQLTEEDNEESEVEGSSGGGEDSDSDSSISNTKNEEEVETCTFEKVTTETYPPRSYILVVEKDRVMSFDVDKTVAIRGHWNEDEVLDGVFFEPGTLGRPKGITIAYKVSLDNDPTNICGVLNLASNHLNKVKQEFPGCRVFERMLILPRRQCLPPLLLRDLSEVRVEDMCGKDLGKLDFVLC